MLLPETFFNWSRNIRDFQIVMCITQWRRVRVELSDRPYSLLLDVRVCRQKADTPCRDSGESHKSTRKRGQSD